MARFAALAPVLLILAPLGRQEAKLQGGLGGQVLGDSEKLPPSGVYCELNWSFSGQGYRY